jgi:hypothetical protein
MSYEMMASSPPKVNRRFGGHIASIFKVEEYVKQDTSVKAGGS